MVKKYFIRLDLRILLFFFFLSPLTAFSLREQIGQGEPGSYVVTSHGKQYTAFILRAKKEGVVDIDEISTPLAPSSPWREWLMTGAPGHTSWVSYSVDTSRGALLSGYSHVKEEGLQLNNPEITFSLLLNLPLSPIPPENRRKIGSTPASDGPDHRKAWTPPVTVGGKAQDRPPITAFSSRWPTDDSVISGAAIEVYLSSSPFPVWIDVKTPHYTGVIRTVDSGVINNASSP
jgi:hypothetical protein